MTQIDFYLLGPGSNHNGEHFACRLVQKAYSQGHSICLLTENEAHSKQLDRLMWTFSASSFVPHETHAGDHASDVVVPVLVTHETPPDHFDDVLVSLCAETPSWFSRFCRLAEVVNNSDTAKQLARKRYKYYQDRGYPLNTHEI